MAMHAGPAAPVSLCVMTRGPAARVAALLRLWRPVVAEVVLAVDAGGDLETLDACAGLADRRFVFERDPAWPPERPLPWLYDQCTAEWALRIDDDEVPGASLLERLAELTATPDTRTVHLPRRWLFPGPGEYIVDEPWAADWQMRLVKQGTWTATGKMHTSLDTMGPRVWAEWAPLYHADLLIQPLERRREKAARYEHLRPGHASGRHSVNALYLPEEASGLRMAAVPDEDRPMIRALLEPGSQRPFEAGAPAGVERASAEELLRHVPTARSRALYRARRAALAAGRLVAGRG
jgi:hypothetical protein